MAVWQSTTPPPAAPLAPTVPDDLRFLVEIDRRRGSIGLHVATDLTRPSRVSCSLWLDIGQAERIGQEILAAAAAARSPDGTDRVVPVARGGQ